MICIKKVIIILSIYVKNNDYKYSIYTHFHAKSFVKKGFRVIVMAPYSVLPLVGLFKKNKVYNVDGVEVNVCKKYSLSRLFKKCIVNVNGLLYYLAIKKKVMETIKNNDVIHIDAHNFQSQGYAAYLLKKRFKSIFCTITLHGSDLEQTLSYKSGINRLKKISKVIDYYVCVSDKIKNKLLALGINNVVTIYNGIEMYPVVSCQREKTFITASYFSEEKNMDLLIDAFSLFCKKNNDYKLKIIGDGKLRKSVELQIKKLNLEDRVELLGAMSNQDVFKEFSRSYAFFLVSSPEGFGIVYPEAMYCGCITVGTKNEGIDGFIKDGINGFLVNLDINEIAKKMDFVVNNKCDQIISQGMIDAKTLTWDRNCQNYLRLNTNYKMDD